jgi:hypothetical protein
MKFTADNYFRIGRAHEMIGLPCQDYAISGIENGVNFIAVSDGCSASADTDIGARLILNWWRMRILSCHHIYFTTKATDFRKEKGLITKSFKGILQRCSTGRVASSCLDGCNTRLSHPYSRKQGTGRDDLW